MLPRKLRMKTEPQLIRIMKSSSQIISMDYLKGFKQVLQAVVFTQLFSTSSGIKFFNSYRGSRVTTLKQVQFTFDKELLIRIDEMCHKTTRIFDVNAFIRWLRKKALIQTSGGNPVYVRERILYDTAGHY